MKEFNGATDIGDYISDDEWARYIAMQEAEEQEQEEEQS